MNVPIIFKATIWVYPGPAAWHFVTLPEGAAAEVRSRLTGPPTAFGSVKVAARIGDARWLSSLFPDNNTNSYVLPLKKAVRQQLGVAEGDSVTVELTLL